MTARLSPLVVAVMVMVVAVKEALHPAVGRSLVARALVVIGFLAVAVRSLATAELVGVPLDAGARVMERSLVVVIVVRGFPVLVVEHPLVVALQVHPRPRTAMKRKKGKKRKRKKGKRRRTRKRQLLVVKCLDIGGARTPRC
jgi:hypothetical protein